MAELKAPSSAVAALLADAEAEAQRTSSLIRIGILVVMGALFVLLHPSNVPDAFVAVVLGTEAVYLVVAVAAWWTARRGRVGLRLTLALAVMDAVLLLAMLSAGLHVLELPTAIFGAAPPFIVAFLLLALGAFRFTPLPILVTTALLAVVGIAVSLGGSSTQVRLLLDGDVVAAPVPFFDPGINLLRIALLAAVALVLGAAVLRNRRLVLHAAEISERASNLARYLPPPVAARVAEEGTAALSRGREQPVAILFADVVGFTGLAERLSPEQVGALLTDLRSVQRQAVERHGGIVDKFVGDGMMAVFGVPDPSPHAASSAIAAARALLVDMRHFNERHRPPVALGIGVHAGPAFVGAVGDEERLEYAVLGDAVNVAQRVERLTRETGHDLLVTEAALSAAGHDVGGWYEIPGCRVRGRAGAVTVFAPAGSRSTPPPEAAAAPSAVRP